MTDYATLAQVKAHIGIADSNTASDDKLGDRIEEASRLLDRVLNVPDGELGPVTATRYFDGVAGKVLDVPALRTVTTLKADTDSDGVYEQTWTEGTDFLLYPLNDTIKRHVVLKTGGSTTWPTGQKSIEIAGEWGPAAVDPPIRLACILLAARYYKRGDTPFAVYGNGDIGFTDLKENDPDVALILTQGGYLDDTTPRWTV